MKKIVFLIACLLPLAAAAQKGKVDAKYMAGAVTEQDGRVVFSHKYKLPSQTKDKIFASLLSYAQGITKGENQLPQCRVAVSDEANGLIAVNMEEWLYFRKTAWVTNRTRFFYQLLYQVSDGGFTVTMRDIHYLYDEDRDKNGGIQYNAEDWITDKYALVKNGTRLSRLSGKFRTFTIDRKDQLFRDSFKAAGGNTKRKVVKTIEVEEEVEE